MEYYVTLKDWKGALSFYETPMVTVYSKQKLFWKFFFWIEEAHFIIPHNHVIMCAYKDKNECLMYNGIERILTNFANGFPVFTEESLVKTF